MFYTKQRTIVTKGIPWQIESTPTPQILNILKTDGRQIQA